MAQVAALGYLCALAQEVRYDATLDNKTSSGFATPVGSKASQPVPPCDVAGLKHQSGVDVVEVRSNSQTRAELEAKLQMGMDSMPEGVGGEIRVVEPGANTDPFAN